MNATVGCSRGARAMHRALARAGPRGGASGLRGPGALILGPGTGSEGCRKPGRSAARLGGHACRVGNCVGRRCPGRARAPCSGPNGALAPRCRGQSYAVRWPPNRRPPTRAPRPGPGSPAQPAAGSPPASPEASPEALQRDEGPVPRPAPPPPRQAPAPEARRPPQLPVASASPAAPFSPGTASSLAAGSSAMASISATVGTFTTPPDSASGLGRSVLR